MKGATLYVDQYGNRFYATTRKELQEQIGMGHSRVAKMYRDTSKGVSKHIGYVIGGHWLRAYAPIEA